MRKNKPSSTLAILTNIAPDPPIFMTDYGKALGSSKIAPCSSPSEGPV